MVLVRCALAKSEKANSASASRNSSSGDLVPSSDSIPSPSRLMSTQRSRSFASSRATRLRKSRLRGSLMGSCPPEFFWLCLLVSMICRRRSPILGVRE